MTYLWNHIDYLIYVKGHIKISPASNLKAAMVVRVEKATTICTVGIAGGPCSMEEAQIMPTLLHNTNDNLILQGYHRQAIFRGIGHLQGKYIFPLISTLIGDV